MRKGSSTSLTSAMDGPPLHWNCKDYSMVIDGECLTIVLSCSALREQLFLLSQRCATVICCRVSPLQKVCSGRLRESEVEWKGGRAVLRTTRGSQAAQGDLRCIASSGYGHCSTDRNPFPADSQ